MILHVALLDKFIPPFIEFLRQHFDASKHHFWLKGEKSKYVDNHHPIDHQPNASFFKNSLGYLRLIVYLHKSEKVILHSLFDKKTVLLICSMPWLLKKCYWVIWGGDLYAHEDDKKDWRWHRDEWVRRFAVSRIGHFVTHVRGDYELAKKWYGAKGQWHECFMYTSNLYSDYQIVPEPHDSINILLGNSATVSNNHFDTFEILRPFLHENIKIYCPLSYGDPAYGHKVATAGKSIFGEKFIPLIEFMPLEKYIDLLANTDIALFNHNRQQGMGNITTLLGLGKPVYMRRGLMSSAFLNELGVTIGDITSFPKTISDHGLPTFKNKAIISNYFSNETLILQLKELFK